MTPAAAFANAAAQRAENTAAVEKLLVRHGVDKERLSRLVGAIMASSTRPSRLYAWLLAITLGNSSCAPRRRTAAENL